MRRLAATILTFAYLVPAGSLHASATPSVRVVDVQGMQVVTVAPDAEPAETLRADIVILGGGLGGVAAALSACEAGRTVILTEETDWLGGQATAQGVSALDENGHIERSGGTRSYLEFRTRIRDWYWANTKLTAKAKADPMLDPGNSWVTRLGFEPKVGVAAIDDMLAPHRASQKLKVLYRCRIARAERTGRNINGVEVVHLERGTLTRLEGTYFIDATELGDALVVCKVAHVVGAESREQTGEPHARPDGPHPECVQSYTYPFALRLQKEPGQPIPRPPGYEQNREKQPYTLKHLYHDKRGWVRYGVFEHVEGSYGPFWTYRRLIDAANFNDPAYSEDVAMINWPGNDYRGGSLLADSPDDVLRSLREAKLLALGFCHWLQTEAPRDGGGQGHPNMVLDRQAMGTTDGLSKYPYIRESRRIRAAYTIVEQDVASAFQENRARARHFADSVGIGWYGIDIHPNDAEQKLPPAATRPFQIALGALVSVDTDNLIPACKNIGTTHITNGCYRLHPIEWNIGEAAGLLAASCLRLGVTPAELRADAARLLELQHQLVNRGVPIFWYIDIGPQDPGFAAAQLAPFTDPKELRRTERAMQYRTTPGTRPGG